MKGAGVGSNTLDVWTSMRLFIEDEVQALDPKLTALILGHIRGRQWRKILDLTSDILPTLYSAEQHRVVSQLAAFLKKNADFADRESCVQAAKASFYRAERLCRITNRRLDWYWEHPHRMNTELAEQVTLMRTYIESTLGPVEHFIRRIPDLVYVTNGATSDHPRHRSLPYMKVRKNIRATRGAWPFVEALSRFHLGTSPRFVESCCNRITTVPKTSLTDRTIACEPAGNLPFQLAIDVYLKERLSRLHGIDLKDQTRNQSMARLGSIDGSLATIDLSMASDTLALNTVLFLFPEDWVRVLMALRCAHFKGVFGYGTYSKFSSMGNGFTFVLETLVFAAMCSAVGAKSYSVYGDDIIIESRLYHQLTRLLRFFGFVPNEEKSFHTGLFRESCGRDFFGGVDVRPFFWRKSPKRRHELCHYINGLSAISKPGGKLWGYLRGLVRKESLPLVPFCESTTSGVHIHPTDARRYGFLRTRGWVDVYKGFITRDRLVRARPVQAYLLWFFQAGTGSDRYTNTREACSSATITSEVTSLRTKVRRGTIVWRMPDVRKPYLYLWSEYLFSQK